MKLVFTDANGLATTPERAAVVVTPVSRRDIERGLSGDIVDRLMTLSDSPALFDRFEDRLVLWVSGYDHDPRELWQIPEVCRFFRAVDAQWNFWVHFAMCQGGVPSLITSLLCDSEVVASDNKQVQSGFVDEAEGNALLDRLEAATRHLYRAHGRSDQSVERTLQRFHHALLRG